MLRVAERGGEALDETRLRSEDPRCQKRDSVRTPGNPRCLRGGGVQRARAHLLDDAASEGAELGDECGGTPPARVPVVGDDRSAAPAELPVRVRGESGDELPMVGRDAEEVRRPFVQRDLTRAVRSDDEDGVRVTPGHFAHRDPVHAEGAADDGVGVVDLDQPARLLEHRRELQGLRAGGNELDGPPRDPGGRDSARRVVCDLQPRAALEQGKLGARQLDGVERPEDPDAVDEEPDPEGLLAAAAPASPRRAQPSPPRAMRRPA